MATYDLNDFKKAALEYAESKYGNRPYYKNLLIWIEAEAKGCFDAKETPKYFVDSIWNAVIAPAIL